MMKKSYCLFLFVSLVVLSSVVSCARLLPQEQDEKEITQLSTSDFSTLMGLEECEDKDEECLKRRVAAEAHLDYIYTQNHKKP